MGYTPKIGESIDLAIHLGERRNTTNAEKYLRDAKRYARIARVEIPEYNLSDIEFIINMGGVEHSLMLARYHARHEMETASALNRAENYAVKAGIDISNKVTQIKGIAASK